MSTGTSDGRFSLSRWSALLAIVAASFCFSLMATCVRMLALAKIPSYQIIVFRGLIQVFVCVGIFIYMGRPISTWLGESRTEVFWLSCRALVGFIAVSLNFAGIGYLPLAESQILGQMLPVFSPVVAWLALGEPWHLIEFVSALVGLCGIILIARPAALFGEQSAFMGVDTLNHERRILGICFCLMATFFTSCSFVLVRFLGTRVKVHWSLVMLYQALGTTLLPLPCFPLFHQVPVMPSLWSGGILVLIGLLGSIGQIGCTFGMQREKAATATLVQKGLSPFFGFLNQLVFLPSDPIYWTSIAGFVATVCSVMIAGVGKLWYNDTNRRNQMARKVDPLVAVDGYTKLDGA